MSDDPFDAGITLAGPRTIAMDLDEVHAPGAVVEQAANAVRFMLATAKMEADFSRESLAIVDYYVTQARAEVKERPEALPLLANAVGAYLGEVVRRTHACWWRIDHQDPGAWRLEFAPVFLAFYPVQVITTSLLMEDDEAGFSGFELPKEDRLALIDRLAEQGNVSEEMYFAPTTKVEVLDVCVDALLAKRARNPDAARPYVPGDYAAS